MKNNLKSLLVIRKQLLYILDTKQKIQAVGMVLLLLIGAMLETLGVSAIVPLIQVLLDVEAIMQYEFVTWWVSLFEGDPTIILFISMAVLLAGIYLVKNICMLLIAKAKISFRWTLQSKLSKRMFNSYLKRPYIYYVNINSAQVIRGVIADVNSTYSVLEYFFNIVAELLTILLIYLILCVTDFFMATVTLGVLAVISIGVMLLFKRLLGDAGNQHRSITARQNKSVLQMVNGIKEINVTNRKRHFEEEYSEISDLYKDISIKYNFLNECPNRIIETVCVLVIMVVVGIKLISGVAVGEFISTLAVFALGIFRILPYTAQLVAQINGLVFYCPGLAATYQNLHEAEEYTNCLIDKPDSTGKMVFSKEFTVENLYWSYPNSQKEILTNISLSIKKGEAIALIGSSGAGKTTLVDCLLGVLIPKSGNISIDGKCIWEEPNSWSKIISYVPQNVYLADDTIRNNIAFGIDEKEIKDECIWNALEKAQLKDFVESLPNGIYTTVGERGIRFSGGQRQRIAIARALYYDPEILVLDEATSALDHETETAVMNSIEQLYGKKTLIISAHRLSTIEKCDRIYRIENGKISEVERRSLFEK